MIICFDLDGTLVDTEEWVSNAIKESFRKNGLKVNDKKIYQVWGLTIRSLIKKEYPSTKKEKTDKIVKDFEKTRSKTINKLKPFKNTKRVLRNLSKKYTMCLVSNNKHRRILQILNQTKIDKKLFKAIVGYDDVRKPKPFPNEIYKAERELGKRVKFMVGDTEQDIKTAKRAKVKSIIILTAPKEHRKSLKNADYKIKDIKELPKLIKEVN